MTQTASTTTSRVKAYATFDYRGLKRFETVYFVDGAAVYSSGERPFNDAFNPKGETWTRVDSLPEGVEFIGNYATPAVVS